MVPPTSSGKRYRTWREGSTKNEGGATAEDRLVTPLPGPPPAPTPTINSRRDASLPPRLHHTAAPTPQCSPPTESVPPPSQHRNRRAVRARAAQAGGKPRSPRKLRPGKGSRRRGIGPGGPFTAVDASTRSGLENRAKRLAPQGF